MTYTPNHTYYTYHQKQPEQAERTEQAAGKGIDEQKRRKKEVRSRNGIREVMRGERW